MKPTLPKSTTRRRRSAFGDATFVAFSGVQIADGYLTYLGVLAFGAGIEGNPLISWYIAVFGAAAALVGAKLLALFCGAILHLTERHGLVALLTIAYLAVAIWPWSRLLFP